MDPVEPTEVSAEMASLKKRLAELERLLQQSVKIEDADNEQDRQTIISALQDVEGGDVFKEAVACQYSAARLQQQQTAKEVSQLKRQVQENSESWETAAVEYLQFDFDSVPELERKKITALSRDLGMIDWSKRSVRDWVIILTRKFNEHFIVSRKGRIAVVFNACTRGTQERLLAADFGADSEKESYDFLKLIKTLGAVYNSVNHAVVAQNALATGLKQNREESVICFLERIQETFHQAYGPSSNWSAFHRTKLVESVVQGVSNKALAQMIAIYQIPTPFSFVHFRDVVVQYAQRVPQTPQDKPDVLTVNGRTCFTCKKLGHISTDCPSRPRRRGPAVCYKCNLRGHIKPNCTTKNVYCGFCKTDRHVTEICRSKPVSNVATAGSHQVEEELEQVAGSSTGAAYATAQVATEASGSNNFTDVMRVLIDTGNVLSIGLCVSEAFFVSLGGQLGDLNPSSLHTAYGASLNSTMQPLGDTYIYIRCTDFNNVILSGPCVVLRGLNEEVIVGMNFLRDNSLNLDLSPHKACLVHGPTLQKQQLVASISFPRHSRGSVKSMQKLEKGGDREQAPLRGAPQKITPEIRRGGGGGPRS